ncbi:Hpt domain-containing protein [Pseudarthrobacter sp. Fe7]|nr:Hpt domain-containing protein [Pseudarthrobacter sp. Fe7]
MASSESAHSPDPGTVPANEGKTGQLPGLTAVARELPLLDDAVLEDLAEDLGGPGIAPKFAQDYAGLWEERRRRLVHSIERADLYGALDIAISIKVTSAMVGAAQLAYLAGRLEGAVRHGDLHESGDDRCPGP